MADLKPEVTKSSLVLGSFVTEEIEEWMFLPLLYRKLARLFTMVLGSPKELKSLGTTMGIEGGRFWPFTVL